MIDPPGLILTALIVYAAAVSTTYAVLFWFRPWRRDPANRALMLKSWGNVIVLLMAAATAVFGDYPGRHFVRLLGFSVFIAGITYLLYALLTSSRAHDYPPYTWGRRIAGRLRGVFDER